MSRKLEDLLRDVNAFPLVNKDQAGPSGTIDDRSKPSLMERMARVKEQLSIEKPTVLNDPPGADEYPAQELPGYLKENFREVKAIVKNAFLGCAPEIEDRYLRPAEKLYRKVEARGLKPDDYKVFSDVQPKPKSSEDKKETDMSSDKFDIEDFQKVVHEAANAREQKKFDKHEEVSNRMKDFQEKVAADPNPEYKIGPLPDTPDTAPDILELGADVYRQRNAIYGDSYKRQGLIMDVLFPDGVHLSSVKDHNRFTVLSTIVSKLLRYTHDFDKPHDDSVLDNMVYFAMLLELDRSE